VFSDHTPASSSWIREREKGSSPLLTALNKELQSKINLSQQ
tara:strand:- start:6 stop:128 length:123 start_codon:yes stop_codon:yes gene_type:complete